MRCCIIGSAFAKPTGYPLINLNKKIKIGVLFSQTGVMQVYGRDLLNISLMAADKINNTGGFDIVYESPELIRPEVFDPAMDKHRACIEVI